MTSPPNPPARPVATQSAHAVRQWVRERIKQGEMKRCHHLRIHICELLDNQTGEKDHQFFTPVCERNSFEWKHPYLNDRQKLEMLEHGLHLDLVKCPEHCTFYRSARFALISHLWKTFWSSCAVPFKWFAKAAWQTQSVIILSIVLILVLWLFPQWLSTVTELIKALRH